MQCDEREAIPIEVVRNLDAWEDGDITVPPQFNCEECGGKMYPEYYKELHGYEYKISDIQEQTLGEWCRKEISADNLSKRLIKKWNLKLYGSEDDFYWMGLAGRFNAEWI